MDQTGRDAEIFRLLPKDDSIPPICSPGVMFHIFIIAVTTSGPTNQNEY